MYSKILLNILIVIIVTVAIILLTNLLWQWQQAKTPLATDNQRKISRPIIIDEPSEIIDTESRVVPPVPEPNNYSRFAGIVREITENNLTLSTIFGEKIISFDDGTIWQKIYLNKFPPLPDSDEIIDLPPAETLNWSDLNAGQEIEVASTSNISGQSQFVASEINLLERIN